MNKIKELYRKLFITWNKIFDFFELPEIECSRCGETVYDTGPGRVHECNIKNVVKKAILELEIEKENREINKRN